MRKALYHKVLWAIPISLYAVDANAWGLFTHLYFSQYWLMAAPLLDPKIQQAIQKLPKLVLAGACLPDLAVISKSFSTTHQWQVSERMIASAENDEEMAIAVGYASHLFVDVIAHNHFVPAHEAKWLSNTIVTHIASEWAMDGHIAHAVLDSPNRLIKQHLSELTHFAARHFELHPKLVKAQLTRLAHLDGLLRCSQLAPLLLWVLKKRDGEFVKNLHYYLNKTEHALSHFTHALHGTRPNWQPELQHLSAAELAEWRAQCLGELRLRMLIPVDYYHTAQKAELH